MDVAFVSNVVYPFVTGGAEKRIHEIGTRLADRGHDITIYGRHFWDGPPTTTHEGMTLRAVAPEADLYEGERRSITEAIDFAVRLVPDLRNHLHRGDHDLVVASVFPYFPVLSSKLAAVGTDVPLITTWHEVWGDYWEEYLGRLAIGGKLMERLTARTPQYPIAVSDSTADRLTEITSRKDIEVVPNGIDVDKVRSAPLPDTSYDILFAGRLIEHKNVDLLVDAFDTISDRYDITLGIIGDGPERERLESQASDLEYADRIDFLGHLETYENVLGHMRGADVFCSPSTREGFGLTYVEAMAANCMVIAADHPDSAAEEVLDGAGFLTDPTVDDIGDTLRSIFDGAKPEEDPLKRARDYDWNVITDQAEQAYRQAINREW